uniref:Uncharacterized protein n=1 Tax=Rhizophora mucronata TaxID=61149 RepID=A0A2P2P780_RHIMU
MSWVGNSLLIQLYAKKLLFNALGVQLYAVLHEHLVLGIQ